jgi:hypothetical protein
MSEVSGEHDMNNNNETPEATLQPRFENMVTGLKLMSELCGLRSDFLTDLLINEKSDWSFVIKAHALMESVVCQLLSTHLRQPSLESVLAERVQMEDRIAMLKALDISDTAERQMLRRLGKLRNDIVHKVQQTDFRFSDYFQNKEHRQVFIDTFGMGWPDPILGTKLPVSRADFIIQNPRSAIASDLIQIIGRTLDAKRKAKHEERLKMIRDALMQAVTVDEKLGPDSRTGS